MEAFDGMTVRCLISLITLLVSPLGRVLTDESITLLICFLSFSLRERGGDTITECV